MTGHLRLDSVTAESLRHSETEWQSEGERERARERRWVQRVQNDGSKCDSAVRKKRRAPFRERTDKERREEQPRCVSECVQM